MCIQQQLSEKFLARYTNSIVKKIDRDNHLDIYVPEIHEKKGTHIFFNTAKDKIKVGFYCRDEEFVSSILVNNEQTIQDFYDLGQATSLTPSPYSSSGSSFTKLICPTPGYSASY